MIVFALLLKLELCDHKNRSLKSSLISLLAQFYSSLHKTASNWSILPWKHCLPFACLPFVWSDWSVTWNWWQPTSQQTLKQIKTVCSCWSLQNKLWDRDTKPCAVLHALAMSTSNYPCLLLTAMGHLSCQTLWLVTPHLLFPHNFYHQGQISS